MTKENYIQKFLQDFSEIKKLPFRQIVFPDARDRFSSLIDRYTKPLKVIFVVAMFFALLYFSAPYLVTQAVEALYDKGQLIQIGAITFGPIYFWVICYLLIFLIGAILLRLAFYRTPILTNDIFKAIVTAVGSSGGIGAFVGAIISVLSMTGLNKTKRSIEFLTTIGNLTSAGILIGVLFLIIRLLQIVLNDLNLGLASIPLLIISGLLNIFFIHYVLNLRVENIRVIFLGHFKNGLNENNTKIFEILGNGIFNNLEFKISIIVVAVLSLYLAYISLKKMI